MDFRKLVSKKYKISANKQMSLKDYVEKLENSYGYDQIIDEMLRSGGFSDKKMLEYTKKEAKKENIDLIDEDKFDEDTFHDIYKTSEKGLS
jgi:hypothetical protein